MSTIGIPQATQPEQRLFSLMDFQSAMAYWIVRHRTIFDLKDYTVIIVFTDYLMKKYYANYDMTSFSNPSNYKEFTYEQLGYILNEDVFIAIPEIYELNQIKGDNFIDLGAFARNIRNTMWKLSEN